MKMRLSNVDALKPFRLHGDSTIVGIALIATIVFFAFPIGLLVVYSVFQYDPLVIFTPTFTLDNYMQLIVDPYNRAVVIRTITLSAAATLTALVVGYIVALYMRRCSSAMRILITILVLTPLLLSDVILGYAWLIVLGSNTGALQGLLNFVGLIDGPIQVIGTEAAVYGGLVYFGLGFMVLNLSAAIDAIGESEMRAAAVLGAGRFRRFVSVMLPLSAPGVLSGILVTFAMTSSAFVLPLMLGGRKAPVLSGFIYRLNSFLLNWPLGAAAAITLLIVATATSWALIAMGRKKSRTAQSTRSQRDKEVVGV